MKTSTKKQLLFLIAQPIFHLHFLPEAWQRLDSPKNMSTIYTTSQIPGEFSGRNCASNLSKTPRRDTPKYGPWKMYCICKPSNMTLFLGIYLKFQGVTFWQTDHSNGNPQFSNSEFYSQVFGCFIYLLLSLPECNPYYS